MSIERQRTFIRPFNEGIYSRAILTQDSLDFGD